MTMRYADRAFLSLGSTPILDLQTMSLKINKNSKAVDSMTRDGRNRGHVRGNLSVDIAATVAIEQQLARPKIDFIDYEANDLQLTIEIGADVFVVTGLFDKDSSTDAAGVGTEAKTSFNWGALNVTDAIGNAVELFDIQLAG